MTFTFQAFSGVLFDIFSEIQSKLNFSYTMVPAKDMKYGSVNETNGNWNGIMGMLQGKEVDLTIMDLTILDERSQVVALFIILKLLTMKEIIVLIAIYLMAKVLLVAALLLTKKVKTLITN